MPAASPALGVLDRASFVRFLRRIEDGLEETDQRARDHWRSYSKNRNNPGETYHLFNALGYTYGTRLVRAHLAPLLLVAEREGSDTAARAAEPVINDFNWLALEVLEHMERKSPAVVLRAVEDLGPAIPVKVDWTRKLEEATASWGGRLVYFRDFHWDVIGELWNAGNNLTTAILFHRDPEPVVYHREGDYRFFVPERILRMSPEERLSALREVIEDANAEIRKRAYYGPRQAPLPDNPHFTIIVWSNGAEEWFVDQGNTWSAQLAWNRGERSFRLDTDQVVVPHSEFLVHPVIVEFEEHPLFALSLEAKGRGEAAKPTLENIRRVVSRLVRQQNPYGDRAWRYLEERKLLELLDRLKEGEPGAEAELDEYLALIPGPVVAFRGLIKKWALGRGPAMGIDLPEPEKPLFLSPKISITVAARDALAEAGDEPRAFLDRHFYGDWGDLDVHDKAMNDEALESKDRILSVYRTSLGRRFYIITDPDHETTTILLPEEY